MLDDYVFAVMLTEDWMAVPDPGQMRGANRSRHSFCVPKARFREVLEMLKVNEVPFEGPVSHPEHGPFGDSVYFRDPTGNFLEVLWRRDEDVVYNTVQPLGHGGGG
jgi:catechol-2,3-dioxygenase